MKLFGSFFLALFIYSAIIFFFLYFILSTQKQTKKVIYVHTAIIVKNNTPSQKSIIKKEVKKEIKKPIKQEVKETKKTIKKEIKTKSNFSKGGEDIKFDDIFSNVSENVKTTKIKQKKSAEMTKKVGKYQEVIKKLKSMKQTISFQINSGSNNDKQYIQNEFAKVWSEIPTNAGEFVTLQIIVKNGINLNVISTNLDTIRLNEFLEKLREVDISKIKSFNGIVTFKAKLKENK